MPRHHLISMYGPETASAPDTQETNTTLTTQSSSPIDRPAAHPKDRRTSIFFYGECDAEPMKESSGLDLVVEAAAIVAEGEEKFQDPPLHQQWPEGQRDVLPIAHDASGKSYVPKTNSYYGINYLLQAAGSMGDLPGTPTVDTSSRESEPVLKKSKGTLSKGQRSDVPAISGSAVDRELSEWANHVFFPTESAWHSATLAPPESEARFRSFPTAETTTRNDSISEYHPSTAASSPSPPESEPTSVKPILQNHPRQPPPPSKRVTSLSPTRAKPSTRNPGIKWSIDDGRKLAELRNPHRKGGAMAHKDVGQILGRSALSCRLHVDKMKKKGMWPWTGDEGVKA